MAKFRKAINFRVISLFIAVAFSVHSVAYGMDMSGVSCLRKQLDFNEDKNPIYWCTLIAIAIQKSILAGRAEITPRLILEDGEEYPISNLLQRIELMGINIEIDKKDTIWVYYEPENIYIAIAKKGKIENRDLRAFEKAKINYKINKDSILDGKHIKVRPRNKILKRIFVANFLVATLVFNLIITSPIVLKSYINYDIFGEEQVYGLEKSYKERERYVLDLEFRYILDLEFNAQNYLAQLDYLKNGDLNYNKILGITNWLNARAWEIRRESLSREDIERILDFLEDSEPIKSSSISARWLISISKRTILSLVIPAIYRSYNPEDAEAELIINRVQNLSRYQEYLGDIDKLFFQYFPSIDPQELLNERIQQHAKQVLHMLESKDYQPQYSKSHEVVNNLFSTFGTLEDMEADIREIHYLETTDTIEIPIWKLDSIARLRRLDPMIKKYIIESAKRHNLPPRLVLAHLVSVWKRTYAPVVGIDIAKNRGKISAEQAKWLKRAVKTLDAICVNRNIYNTPLDPDLMAFIAGVGLDAQSTIDSGVKVYQNQRSKNLLG